MAFSDSELPHQIWVEGPNDERVIREIMYQNNMQENFDIEPAGGVEEVIKAIRGAVLQGPRESVSFVVDANDNLQKRWDELCSKLRERGYNPPNEPSPNGTILPATDECVRAGIWIMPDNKSPGAIEDFVAEMMSKNPPGWERALKFVDEIPNEERLFPEHKYNQVVVRVWLAMRASSDRLDKVISREKLPVDGPLCQAFCEWLRRVMTGT